MANEKKIIFSGEDQISQKANQMYSNITSYAKKYTENIKEQNSLIKDQVRDIQKKLSLESQGAITSARNMMTEANKMAPGVGQQNARKEAKSAINSAEKRYNESEKVVELLQGILSTSKSQQINSEKAEKSSQKGKLSSEAQYESMKSLARQEVRENRKGVAKKIIRAEEDNYSKSSPEQAEKLMYQKSLLSSKANGGSGNGSITGQVFIGTFLANAFGQLVNVISKIGSADSGDRAANSLLSGIPIIGDLLGQASNRTLDEQYAVGSKELELSARSGRNIKGVSNIKAGFSTKESLGITDALMNASGSANGANSTSSAMMLQRGLGLPISAITQIVKDTRTARSSADMIQIITEVINANPELKGDRTKLSEVLAQSSQLINQIAQQGEGANVNNAIGMVGALRSVGGSFADPNLGGQRMGSINSALTSPGSDFQKTRNFGVLSGLNPGGSYFQMLESQEQGLGKKGFLGGLMKQLKRETGGGENQMLSVMGNLNIPAQSARKLVEAFNKNPKLFDNFSGGKDDLDSILGNSLSKTAEKNTNKLDIQKADIDNAFLNNKASGIMKASSLTYDSATKKFEAAIDKLIKGTNTPKEGWFGSLYNSMPKTPQTHTE